MNKFNITIPDLNNEGDGMSKSFTFESNTPLTKIQTAYDETCNKLGIRLNEISNEIEGKLIDNGINTANYYRTDCNKFDISKFPYLIFDLVKQSIPRLKCIKIKYDKTQNKLII